MTVNQYFRLVVKMGRKPGTTLVIVKFLISHLRCLLFVIFRIIKYNKEQQVKNCWFYSLADSLLKFSTEIYILSNTSKTEIFYIFRQFFTFIPVQCCPEKANLMQNFCSWYLIERLSGWCTHSVHPKVI